MGRPKKPVKIPFSPLFKGYGTLTDLGRERALREPQALIKTEQSSRRQVRFDEETLIWGDGDLMDALPLYILNAVNQSPTTLSCLEQVETFTAGAGFADPGLESLVIDEDGTTLLEHHYAVCRYLTLLDGWTVNFKYDSEGKITNAFVVGIESIRFKKPDEETTAITTVKYNPYFGTDLYKKYQSREYPVFDKDAALNQMQEEDYMGQIYFNGKPRPPYKFYPVPKYWSAREWIYVDGQIQQFHKNNMDNGFFQSALLKVIGNPNEPSEHPEDKVEVTGSDNTKRLESRRTIGERFDMEMNRTFSGVKKAGSVFVMWADNKDTSPDVTNFPVNTNFDILSGTFTDAIRGITIATGVPAILCNLPQQVSSLGSDGTSMQRAIELMQARVRKHQARLENYYNNILIPNLQNTTSARVRIQNYTPVKGGVPVDKNIWEWLTDAEKAKYIKDNEPSYTILRTPDQLPNTPNVPVPGITVPKPGTDDPTKTPVQVNEALKGLKVSEINRVMSIVAKYKKGDLTTDQAQQLLSAYGFDNDQITAWITTPVEI